MHYDLTEKTNLQPHLMIDPLVGTESLRFIGEVSTKVAELNVKCWNWGDPVLTQAFFDKVKDKLQDPEDIQKIAAMDAIGAFAASSYKGEIFIRRVDILTIFYATRTASADTT